MTHTQFSNINISDLQELCEPVTLMKGTQLEKLGAVRNLTSGKNSVITAMVEGTSTYMVQLMLQPKLHGSCTCPAAEYQPFCKHMVAVALSLKNGINADENEVQDPERTRIRRYFSSMDKDEMLDTILDYLVRDESIWNQLLTLADLDQDAPSLQSLMSMINKALPESQIWNWNEVEAYFMRAEQQVELVLKAAASLDAEKQWTLINYLLERLNTVLEHLDDSGGHRYGIEGMINEAMPKILLNLQWSEQEKGQWMFEQLTSYKFDVFPSIEEHFVDAYRNNQYFLQLCRDAIDNSEKNNVSSWILNKYAQPLIEQAEDWHEVALIKQKILQKCSDYLQLVQLYLDHHEPLDAEFWLTKARAIATKHEERQCDRLQVDIFLHQDEKSSAWKLLNRLFEQWPIFLEYQELRDFKDDNQIDDVQFISRIEQVMLNMCQQDIRGLNQVYSDSLVKFYMDVQLWDKACDWVDHHKAATDVMITLANHIVVTQADKALAYYVRVVETVISRASNSAYKEAIQYLQDLESRLPSGGDTHQAFYRQIKQLAEGNKRKRNMFALFKQHYGEYL